MRKVVANLFLSLDGLTEAPERWHFPYFSEAMEAAIAKGLPRASPAF